MMKQRCNLTYIVPVYKVKYDQLRRCVDGLIGQRESNLIYEILLVDDGSPDDCGIICDEYARKYDGLVRVIHQENQGLSVVRNNGVRAAFGDWVSFVDGDDWIDDCTNIFIGNFIECSQDSCDILIWDGFAEHGSHSEKINFLNTEENSLLSFEGAAKERLIDRIIPIKVTREDINKCTDLGVTWARVYRRDFLIENNIWNVPGLKMMQDSVFNLWAFERARKICYKFEPHYHYSIYNESASKKYDPTIIDTAEKLYNYYAEFIKKTHDEEAYWQRIYIRTVRILVKCLSKDYANLNNKSPMKQRVKKMRKDLDRDSFRNVLENCKYSGQDIRFKVILFLLKHKLFYTSIIANIIFEKLRAGK